MDTIKLVGFKKEKELVIKLINKNILPHAFILVGKKSIGKSIFSKVLASKIALHNAEFSKQESLFFNKEKLERGFICNSYPDLHILIEEDEKTRISVEQARGLLQKTSLNSYNGLGTFIIIQDAEKLSVPAANALLKSLEEPNPLTYYILTTEAAHLIPETILSRAFQINCTERSHSEINTILQNITGDTTFEINSEVYKTLDGSLELLIKEEEFDKSNHLPLNQTKTKSTIEHNIQQIFDLKKRALKILSIKDSFNQKSQLIQFFRTSEKNEHIQNCKLRIFFNALSKFYSETDDIEIKKLDSFQEIIKSYSESQIRNLDLELQLAAIF